MPGHAGEFARGACIAPRGAATPLVGLRGSHSFAAKLVSPWKATPRSAPSFSREVNPMTIQVPIFRSYRLFLPSNGAKGRDPQDDYVQTQEYSYEPIEPRLTVSDDSILDFWHGSGE